MVLCCGASNQVLPFDEDYCDGLFLGLEGAGKTLLTRRLQFTGVHDAQRLKNFTHNTWPTTGVEIAILKTERNGVFRLLRTRELGGCMGPIWPNYFSDARALVFLLDGAQPGSWQEAGAKLRDILVHRHMKGKPCLVVLNKLDASDSKAADLERSAQQALGWDELQSEYDVSMTAVSALAGDNVGSITSFLLDVKLSAGAPAASAPLPVTRYDSGRRSSLER